MKKKSYDLASFAILMHTFDNNKRMLSQKIGNGPISQFKKKLYVLKYIRKAVGTKILEMGTKKKSSFCFFCHQNISPNVLS